MIFYLNPSQHFKPVTFFRSPTVPQPVEKEPTYGHGVWEFMVFEGSPDSDSGPRIYDPLLRMKLSMFRGCVRERFSPSDAHIHSGHENSLVRTRGGLRSALDEGIRKSL